MAQGIECQSGCQETKATTLGNAIYRLAELEDSIRNFVAIVRGVPVDNPVHEDLSTLSLAELLTRAPTEIDESRARIAECLNELREALL